MGEDSGGARKEVEDPAEEGGGGVAAGGEDFEGFAAEFNHILSMLRQLVKEDEFSFSILSRWFESTLKLGIDKVINIFVDLRAMVSELRGID